MTVAEAAVPAVPPLSVLAEHERDLAEGVYRFALETIGPRVMEMDRANVMDPGIIRKKFETFFQHHGSLCLAAQFNIVFAQLKVLLAGN